MKMAVLFATKARDLQALIENRKVCEACEYIEDLEIDYPDEPYKGGIRYCGECDAQYYEEWGDKVSAANEEAHFNHPELPFI